MTQTYDDIMHETTQNYLQSLDPDNLPDIGTMKGELLQKTRTVIDAVNSIAPKNGKFKMPQSLTNYQVAKLIMFTQSICCISYTGDPTNSLYDVLAVYQTEGKNKGLYVTDHAELSALVRQYNYEIDRKGITEVFSILRELAPHKSRCKNKDLIAVNNGIVNYKTKDLMPFDKKYVFTAKSRVDYKPNPINPIIHNDDDGTDWDLESHMRSISPHEEVVNLLWQILGALIRPGEAWDKFALLYAEDGNNGKGTFCELARNLVGPESCASIKLADFEKDFLLSPLISSNAIVVDENNTVGRIADGSNLKAIVTGDTVMINRKYKDPVSFRFSGFMVQCINRLPEIADTTDSFYRRMLIIPFESCFTGHEKKYIKHDYMKRKEVLEYVLWRVINMPDYHELTIPAVCMDILEENKVLNDPVREFMKDNSEKFIWDLLPFEYLYAVYKKWFDKTHPGRSCSIISDKEFKKQIQNLMPYGGWRCECGQDGKPKQMRRKNLMDRDEWLAGYYGLSEWYRPMGDRYRGLIRDTVSTNDNGTGLETIQQLTDGCVDDNNSEFIRNSCNDYKYIREISLSLSEHGIKFVPAYADVS